MSVLNHEMIESTTDRQERIPGFMQSLLRNAKVMVIGAGATGNEVLKNLALTGFGYVFITDMDTIRNKIQGGDRFVLRFCDLNGNPISGVTVGFCNGEYTPVDTDNNGRVSFDGDPNSYHIHLLAVPNGYSKPWEELHVVGEQIDLIITLNPANDLYT